ncbi:MAG: hypothetical protein H6732_03810 [Alphaproteobacteria bacterium]|nr:hypothetical protein [Alphaproteobacteria bacterium]
MTEEGATPGASRPSLRSAFLPVVAFGLLLLWELPTSRPWHGEVWVGAGLLGAAVGVPRDLPGHAWDAAGGAALALGTGTGVAFLAQVALAETGLNPEVGVMLLVHTALGAVVAVIAWAPAMAWCARRREGDAPQG